MQQQAQWYGGTKIQRYRDTEARRSKGNVSAGAPHLPNGIRVKGVLHANSELPSGYVLVH